MGTEVNEFNISRITLIVQCITQKSGQCRYFKEARRTRPLEFAQVPHDHYLGALVFALVPWPLPLVPLVIALVPLVITRVPQLLPWCP